MTRGSETKRKEAAVWSGIPRKRFAPRKTKTNTDMLLGSIERKSTEGILLKMT